MHRRAEELAKGTSSCSKQPKLLKSIQYARSFVIDKAYLPKHLPVTITEKSFLFGCPVRKNGDIMVLCQFERKWQISFRSCKIKGWRQRSVWEKHQDLHENFQKDRLSSELMLVFPWAKFRRNKGDIRPWSRRATITFNVHFPFVDSVTETQKPTKATDFCSS